MDICKGEMQFNEINRNLPQLESGEHMMDFAASYSQNTLLMEGALGERLKREFHLSPDEYITLAGHIYDDEGREALKSLWQGYMSIAKAHQLPFIATTPTRRINRERVAASKYSPAICKDNVSFLKSIRDVSPQEMYVGALIGTKGNAYRADEALTEEDALRFHAWEIERFAAENIDFFFAAILPALSEAAGLARALAQTNIPYIISFMMRNDGCLMDGTRIHDAIAYIDDLTCRRPLCYMTNCIHPSILYQSLGYPFNQTATVQSRFCGIQANASPLTPEELDGSKTLHSSNPQDLAESMMSLTDFIPLKIAGGCCGTDNAYMEEIAGRIRPLVHE